MRIGIDARLLEKRMTGVGRYLAGIVKELPTLDKKNEYTLFTYKSLAGYRAANMKNVATLSSGGEGKLQKLFSPIWLSFILPKFLKKERIDLFFSPNHFLPMNNPAKKSVVAIMDVFPLLDSSFHSPLYRAYSIPALRRSAKKADHIITISEASKRDIINLLGVPEEKVSVTYLSADQRFMPRNPTEEIRKDIKERYHLPGKFILYVGVLEKRKNIEGIIKIADLLKEKDDLPIVLVGRAGFGGEEYIREIAARSNMQYCDYVKDEDLPYFYNLASAFIFASFYEGFGIPVLEAMQSGVPVVTSNRASLPEVVGDAGIALDPRDTHGFVAALRSLLKDKNRWGTFSRQGIARAKSFSAEKTARETLKVFEDCAV